MYATVVVAHRPVDVVRLEGLMAEMNGEDNAHTPKLEKSLGYVAPDGTQVFDLRCASLAKIKFLEMKIQIQAQAESIFERLLAAPAYGEVPPPVQLGNDWNTDFSKVDLLVDVEAGDS